MILEEAKVRSERDYTEAVTYHGKEILDRKELQNKYESMLEKVVAWKPPTSEHVALRDFMIENIKSSIDFDCNVQYLERPKLKSPELWLREYIDECTRDVNYNVKAWHAEVERAKERTEWIRNLKASLS